jgi:DNA-binding NarL/FixJ family response regulator
MAKCERVFIADVSRLDCELLAASLGRSHMRVEGWETNSQAAVAAMERSQPDVALIAARLEDGDRVGLNAVLQLQTASPQTRTVMLLDSSERAIIVEAFRNGARGVFSREQLSSRLIKCIRCVLAGQLWVSNADVEFLVQALRVNPSGCIAVTPESSSLTRRERQIASLVAKGLTNRDIAVQLGLSAHTVKNYLLTIFEKLGVSTRVGLAVLLSGQPDESMPAQSEVSSGRKPLISA